MKGAMAIISGCGKYRYLLKRALPNGSPFGKPCLFIMLNPSTADGNTDDATVRRCIYFAEREKASSLKIVNLYGYRATDPSELKKVTDPQGPENKKYLKQAIIENWIAGGFIIAAWGNHVDMSMIPSKFRALGFMCLGINKNGSPKHPLYLPNNAPLMPWSN